MKKRIVILGDSLGMPRPDIKLEETYPYLLQQKLSQAYVYAKHKRANDSAVQSQHLNLQDDLQYMDADILVIHLGIVDCAPRLFSRRQQHSLQYLKFINRFIIAFMSKRRMFFTKHFPKVYVNIDDFEENMQKLILAGKKYAKRVLVVNIADTTESNKQRSYGFENNIREYNRVLSCLSEKHGVELIDFFSLTTEAMLLDDGIHLSVEGNSVLAEILGEKCL